jgi:hypothetical protein
MGKIELDFLGLIFKHYDELKKLDISFNDNVINFTPPNYLLPYLAMVNSLDEQNRLINIFHPPYSEHYKFIPFYIALAVFKKEMVKMRRKLQPINDEIVVVYNGGICKLKNLDLENGRIGIQKGSRVGHISFEEFLSPLITPYKSYRNSYEKIKDLIRKYQLTNSKSISGLFDIPEFVESDYKSGIIIFSNKKKFQTLFRDLNISSVDISKKLPAVEAVYDTKKNQYKYISLNEGTVGANSSPFILLASYLDIERISDFRSKYSYMDTIIFDDAESRLPDIKKVSQRLISSLESSEEGSLRDAYLLTADSEIYNYYEIEKWKSSVTHHWVSTEKDMVNNDEQKQNIHLVNDKTYSELLSSLYNLKREVGKLYKSFSYNVISPIFEGLSDLSTRFNSIYDPVSFRQDLLKYKGDFIEFSDIFLDEDYHRNFIDSFLEILNHLISLEKCAKYNRLQKIINQEEKINNNFKTVAIVSRNTNEEDGNYLRTLFNQIGIDLKLYNFDISIKELKSAGFDKIYFLEIRRPFTNSLFIHDYSSEIHVLLSKYEFGYYKKAFKYSSLVINSITNHSARGKLLNLDEIYVDAYIEKSWIYSTNIRDYVANLDAYDEYYKEPATDEESDNFEKSKLSYDDVEAEIEKILLQKFDNNRRNDDASEKNITTVRREQEVLLFFEDGSRERVLENKNYYRAIESNINNISDLQVKACEIKPGDELFVFDIHKEDLLELLIRNIKRSDHFKEIYEISETWRDNLKVLCDEVGFDRAAELVSHYLDRSIITLKHWYYGDTFAPQRHEDVILALNNIAKTRNIKGLEHMDAVADIRDASSTIKSLLLRIPRLLKDGFIRQFYDLKDMTGVVNQSEAELIDEILKDVEIKTVRHVLEISNI